MISVQNLKFRVLISLFFICMFAFAQKDSHIKDVDELAEQKRIMFQNYPGLFMEKEINNVEKLDSKHSKIFYTINNVNFEAVVNSNMKDLLLVATCQEIQEEKLPAIVIDAFHESKYGSSKIEKSFIVTTPYSSNFYRIDVNQKKKKEKNMKSLFYDHLGKYRKPPY